MTRLQEAVATIKLDQLSRPDVDDAILYLLQEVEKYRNALAYYATESHWIDGTPMKLDGQGLLTDPDNGFVARYALGLLDPQIGED